MTDLADLKQMPLAPMAPVNEPPATLPSISTPKKAAIIIGALGTEAAGPILEQLDEASLRNFASAMCRIERVGPDVVHATIAEFLTDLDMIEQTVNGGLVTARNFLQQYVNEATLTRIMDDADSPSVHNVWRKLAKVDDLALSEFLAREHPQTASVVVSKLTAEQAARVLSMLPAERAREIVLGVTKISSLDKSVVEAIGGSVSRDFLARQPKGGNKQKAADRVGAIMNFTAGDIRSVVMDYLDEIRPEFANEVRRKMFTFEDVATRVEKRDVAAIIRAVDQETLLKALTGAEENAPKTKEFILSSISSRIAEQLNEELAEYGKVKIREAEEAQTEFLRVVRQLEGAGELQLIELDD